MCEDEDDVRDFGDRVDDAYQYYKDETLRNKPGLHFSGFSTSLIKFEGELFDRLTLKNEDGTIIKYYHYCRCFKIVTDLPNRYLTEEELNQNWTEI